MKLSPRVVGLAIIVAGFAGAFGSIFVIANSPTAILGAVLLTVSSIAIAYGSVMSIRKSWADRTWPPSVTMDASKAQRRLFVLSIFQLIFCAVLVGLSIASLVSGADAGETATAVFFLVLGTSQGAYAIVVQRVFRKLRANKISASADDVAGTT